MDETERRATKIKTFPKEAVMVRAMFKVVKNTAMLDDNSRSCSVRDFCGV